MEGRRGFLRLWAWGVGAVIASCLRTELLVCLSICVLSDGVCIICVVQIFVRTRRLMSMLYIYTLLYVKKNLLGLVYEA